MLKNITLGQYFPGNTAIHRLDPRTKLIWLVGYIVALFLAKGWGGYALMLLILIAVASTAHIRAAALLRGLKPLIFIVIFTAILNLFYGEGEPLVQIWVLKITADGIRTAIFMVLLIMLLVCGSFLLTYTTAPMQLTDGMETLLSPLKRLHVPVHELAMMMSIALRFIPTLIEETDKIMSAQKARGASFDTGTLRERASALLPLLAPLFVSAFRRADELATAMECRCYHSGDGRTRMHTLRFAGADITALALCAGMIAAVCLLRGAGL
ncbi:MAG: energy-coupling factor transporter transmembrane protein EcfT [Oscillospiraceae bacterium]|nr:energy-coupling factor transporter transmembrane protein EcfT [Oscillospiraceae bacterium]